MEYINDQVSTNISENSNENIKFVKPKVKIYNHSEIFNDTNIIYYKIMIFNDSVFVWIGSELLNERNNITQINNLAMSMKTKFVIFFNFIDIYKLIHIYINKTNFFIINK